MLLNDNDYNLYNACFTLNIDHPDRAKNALESIVGRLYLYSIIPHDIANDMMTVINESYAEECPNWRNSDDVRTWFLEELLNIKQEVANRSDAFPGICIVHHDLMFVTAGELLTVTIIFLKDSVLNNKRVKNTYPYFEE